MSENPYAFEREEWRGAVEQMHERERPSCPDCGRYGIKCRQCAGDER